jgi:hypothetical protein
MEGQQQANDSSVLQASALPDPCRGILPPDYLLGSQKGFKPTARGHSRDEARGGKAAGFGNLLDEEDGYGAEDDEELERLRLIAHKQMLWHLQNKQGRPPVSLYYDEENDEEEEDYGDEDDDEEMDEEAEREAAARMMLMMQEQERLFML